MPIYSASLRVNRRGAIAVPLTRSQTQAHIAGARPILSRKGLKMRLTKAGNILAIGTCYFSVDGRTWER